MNAKHTPGPWTVTRFPFSFEISSGDANELIDNPPRSIARVHNDGDDKQGVTETTEANAQLIVAAPALLDALRELCACDHRAQPQRSAAAWSAAEAIVRQFAVTNK